MIINVKNPIGTPIKIPSTLSKIPPWPGKKLPVSFNNDFLFNIEKIINLQFDKILMSL